MSCQSHLEPLNFWIADHLRNGRYREYERSTRLDDTKSMLSYLQGASRGKTLCSEILEGVEDDGFKYEQEQRTPAVTPEDDRYDKKGALSGGYVDTKNSRLKATKAVAEARAKYEEVKANGASITKQIEKIDQTVTQAMGKVQELADCFRSDMRFISDVIFD